MGEFRSFVESSESDARQSIKKLPRSHRRLVRGFELKFHHASTLKGDGDHIGKIEDRPRKKITVAAPHFYSREFVLLHEIAHKIYAKWVQGTSLEKEWNALCAGTRGKVRQNFEEVFAHSYATAYSDHRVEKHNHPKLIHFILHRLPK